MELSDEKLVELAKKDEKSCEILISRYKSSVISLARKYFLQGGSLEDLISEGMIGLYKAIMTYNQNSNASFSTFSYILISRQMINLVKKYANGKNLPLNNSLPIDNLDKVSGGVEPEQVYLLRESEKRFDNLLRDNLSQFEYKALNLYLNGVPYDDIAKSLSSNVKSVDNALSRAKKKIAKKLGE